MAKGMLSTFNAHMKDKSKSWRGLNSCIGLQGGESIKTH